MSQGIFINGRRPASKKAVKAAIATSPETVSVEATSVVGTDYDGPVNEMPEGRPIYFAGPDPYTKRNFYGSILRIDGKIVVK